MFKEYKIRKVFIGLSTLALIYFNSSCRKEWFDEKPDRSVTTPTTLKDYEMILDNSAIMNEFSPGLGEIASDGHYISEQSWQGNISDAQRNAYTWTNTLPYRSISDWNQSYTRILYTNIVLEGLDKVIPKNSDEENQFNIIKGNALFHRAKTYFELAQIWAPQFSPATFITDLSIPIRISSDINVPSTRSTVEQTYQHILLDLLEAKDLLPANPLYKTRGSKPAVFALLAKVYLAMEDYENALVYADSSLFLNKELIDFNTLSPTSSRPLSIFNKEVLFHSRMINYTTIRNLMLIDSIFYSLFENNDLRKTIFFAKSNVTGNITFKGMYSGNTQQFSGLAVDEVFLIRSECLARKGKLTEAMRDLNDLLRTRWRKVNGNTTYIDQTATNSNEALSKIFIERKKELILRGIRWSDLRRLNSDDRFKMTLNRQIGGKLYLLEPNSFKYTFPIPDDIILASGLQQNTGWD